MKILIKARVNEQTYISRILELMVVVKAKLFLKKETGVDLATY